VKKWYIIEDVNPEPWAIGALGVGRRAGGVYPYIGPNTKLVAYQNAIKEQLGDFEPPDYDGEVQLDFFFWRKIETIRRQSPGPKAKVSQGHISDATNLQKGLEDALQGVLFSNDRVVRDIHSVVVEQTRDTKPRIIIRVSSWSGFDPDSLPQFIWDEVDKEPTLFVVNNAWFPEEDAF